MAEASLGVYGAVIGVGIVLAGLAFTLRQRRPHDNTKQVRFLLYYNTK